jgi:hypothetical protein
VSDHAPVRTKLVSIPVGDGKEAAIWRDDEGRTQWTAGVDAWVARFGPPFAPFLVPVLVPVADGTLVAGEMLAGAATVEVAGPAEPRDIVVDGGLYLALVPREASADEVFVLMRDPTGAIVPWPVDKELKRTRLADADARCPACGTSSWDVVERRADAYATRSRLRAVVCHTCGWYDGGWEEVGRRRTPEPDLDDDFSHSPVSEDPTPAEVVKVAAFPVYGVADTRRGRRTLRGYGWDEDRVSSVTVAYERRSAGKKIEIHVTSRRPGQWALPDTDRAKHALRTAIGDDVWREVIKQRRSIEATQLRRQELMRPVVARLEHAPVDRAVIRVGGVPTAFSVIRDHGLAAAAADIDGVNLTVVCRGEAVEEIELTQIPRPDDYFSPEQGRTG